MNINFTSYLAKIQSGHYGKPNGTVKSTRELKVAVVALCILSACLLICYVTKCFFGSKKLKTIFETDKTNKKAQEAADLLKKNKEVPEKSKPKETEPKKPEPKSTKSEKQEPKVKKKLPATQAPIGKEKSVEFPASFQQYKKALKRATKHQKISLFQHTIKEVESHSPSETIKGLLLFVSDSAEIDLRKEACVAVIEDVFLYGKKELTVKLAKWLARNDTFTPTLFKKSLDVLNQKVKDDSTIDGFAIEVLIKKYQGSNWAGSEVRPNDEAIRTAMAEVIKQFPNEDRVATYVTWFMKHDDYNVEMFAKWIGIFREKEAVAGKAVYFPLRDTLVKNYLKMCGTKWPSNALAKIDPKLAEYCTLKTGS